MPLQVIVHEGRSEIVRMVVTILHAQRKIDARLPAGLFEQPRSKAVLQKTVGGSLIYQEVIPQTW